MGARSHFVDEPLPVAGVEQLNGQKPQDSECAGRPTGKFFGLGQGLGRQGSRANHKLDLVGAWVKLHGHRRKSRHASVGMAGDDYPDFFGNVHQALGNAGLLRKVI